MSNLIKRVYLGIPEELVEIILWVARRYRTNPLSHELGGSDVVVEYHDEDVKGYDWIKYPSRYIAKILSKDISNEYEEFEEFGEEEQLSIIKMKIARIFARKYESEEYEKVAFELVWDSDTADELPWKKLKRFDKTEMQDSSNMIESYSFMQFIQAIKKKAGDETVDVFQFNEHGAADIATSKGYVTLWLAKKDRELCGEHPADLADRIKIGKVIKGGKANWIAYTDMIA